MAALSNNTTQSELRAQWTNPGDILSVLLLIGGDIVQKAIAQLIGFEVQLYGCRRPGASTQPILAIPLTPVAFSFGWVAFSFSQLLAAFGDRRLMPSPEKSAIVVNCANAFQRDNASWVLERLLRDHEIRNPVDSSSTSLRIDIFDLEPLRRPAADVAWWLGWLTILTQSAIAIIPLVISNDWGTMMVVLSGTLLASMTCSLPQWKDEKWACQILEKDNVICLTRGNGHKHIMVFIGRKGSPDLETQATAQGPSRRGTPILMAGLTTLWVCLLLSVSSLKNNAWYMVGIGGLGMLQNAYAAGIARGSNISGLQLNPFERKMTILGKSLSFEDDKDAEPGYHEVDEDFGPLSDWLMAPKSHPMPPWLESMDRDDGVPQWLEPAAHEGAVIRIHGALKELEKWVPGAGLAMVQVFFPTSFGYDDSRVRDNINKKFWRRASRTRPSRRRAEQARREAKLAEQAVMEP